MSQGTPGEFRSFQVTLIPQPSLSALESVFLNKAILVIFVLHFLQTCSTPFLSGIVLTKKEKIPCFHQSYQDHIFR